MYSSVVKFLMLSEIILVFLDVAACLAYVFIIPSIVPNVKYKTKRKPAEAGSEFLLRGMSYPKLSLGS